MIERHGSCSACQKYDGRPPTLREYPGRCAKSTSLAHRWRFVLSAIYFAVAAWPVRGGAHERKPLEPGVAMFCAGHPRASHWSARGERCMANRRLMTMDVAAAAIEVISGRQQFEPERYSMPAVCSGVDLTRCAMIDAYIMAGEMARERGDAVEKYLGRYRVQEEDLGIAGSAPTQNVLRVINYRQQAADCAVGFASLLAPIASRRSGSRRYSEAVVAASATNPSGAASDQVVPAPSDWAHGIGMYLAGLPFDRDSFLRELTRDLVHVPDTPRSRGGAWLGPGRGIEALHYLMALRHRDAAVDAFELTIREERDRYVRLWRHAEAGDDVSPPLVNMRRESTFERLDQIPGVRAVNLRLDDLLPAETGPGRPTVEISPETIRLLDGGKLPQALARQIRLAVDWNSSMRFYESRLVKRIRAELHPASRDPARWPAPGRYGGSVDEADAPPIEHEFSEYLPCSSISIDG